MAEVVADPSSGDAVDSCYGAKSWRQQRVFVKTVGRGICLIATENIEGGPVRMLTMDCEAGPGVLMTVVLETELDFAGEGMWADSC